MALAGRKARSSLALASRREAKACGVYLKKGSAERIRRRGSAACRKAEDALASALSRHGKSATHRKAKRKPT